MVLFVRFWPASLSSPLDGQMQLRGLVGVVSPFSNQRILVVTTTLFEIQKTWHQPVCMMCMKITSWILLLFVRERHLMAVRVWIEPTVTDFTRCPGNFSSLMVSASCLKRSNLFFLFFYSIFFHKFLVVVVLLWNSKLLRFHPSSYR